MPRILRFIRGLLRVFSVHIDPILNNKRLSVSFVVILLILTIFTLISQKDTVKSRHLTGQTMGTIVYNIKVMDGETAGFKNSIDSLLVAFNKSLSTYIPDSEISRFNQTNELKNPSNLITDVFKKSTIVYAQTNGAFDPTVGPLIAVWGFGPNKLMLVPDSLIIDSVLLLVNLEKVKFEGGQLTKGKNMSLDFSAIAKGQAVDEVSNWLEKKGIRNYMVEIGGEVRCKGQVWTIGIEDPTVNPLDRRLLASAKLQDRSLATSGNYRNFYEKDGQRYAHIVDPRTGYTAKHNLLSASVFGADCMTVDAFATAFMVLGLEESIRIVESDPDLDALFIFGSGDTTDSYVSTGIASAIEFIKL